MNHSRGGIREPEMVVEQRSARFDENANGDRDFVESNYQFKRETSLLDDLK